MRGRPHSDCSSRSSGSTSSSFGSRRSSVGGDERAGNSRPEPEPDEFGLAADGAPLGPARFFAGVVVAIATMVFGQIPMAIISRSFPNMFLQVVPLLIALNLTTR